MTLERGHSLMPAATSGPEKGTPQLKFPVTKQA